MPPYGVFMHLDLLDAVPGSGSQRRRIMDFVRYLREHPNTRATSPTGTLLSENGRSKFSATSR